MRTLFLLIFLGLGGNILVNAHAKNEPRGGRNYYVDAQDGDDRADGKSERTARRPERQERIGLLQPVHQQRPVRLRQLVLPLRHGDYR